MENKRDKRKTSFFSKGLFEKPFMNSRIKTAGMTAKEKTLGYLIGPFGTLAFIAVVNQLAELYYTEIFYVDNIFGVGTYLVMSWVTKIAAMLCGLFAAYVVEHSVSRQGKFRPLILIGALLCAAAGFFMFWIPSMPDVARLVWIYVFNLLYNGVGFTLFNLRTNMLTLCSRNQNDRNQINLLNNMSGYLIVGTAVTLIVGSVLYYTTLHGQPAENWIVLVGAVALLSVPLSFVQYFFSLERITMENRLADGAVDLMRSDAPKMSTWKQLGALFSSKYWIMAFLLILITQISANLAGYNLSTNFCTVILGATAENNYNLVYTIASGMPMGLGILIIYPLCKKFTIRKTTIAFSVLAVVGCVLGLLAKNSFIPVVAANFIYNMGTLPVIYILGALINSANDEVEYKHDFRPEGTIAMAITACITTVISGAFAGVYETGLSWFGYTPDLGTQQPQGVIDWIYIIRYIAPMVQYLVMILILCFMTLEKQLPAMQQAIRDRRKAEAEALGKVWQSSDELAAIEAEENARLAELARIEDLKAKCIKKNLDFDTENEKYLAKLAKKQKKSKK